MKPNSFLSLLAIPTLLLTFNACQKSEPVETTKVEKVEAVPPVPAPEVKKEIPAISPGTWVGTKTDNSNAANLNIEAGNRMTVLQQDSSTAGVYSIDASVSPAVLSFTPDGPLVETFISQIQWLDPNTITMTSFIAAPAPVTMAAPAVVPTETGSAPAAPFTGSIPPPVNHAGPATSPAMASEIFTITFRKQ